MLPQNQSGADGEEEKRTGVFECRVSRLVSFLAMSWAVGNIQRGWQDARERDALRGAPGVCGWWGGGLDRVRRKPARKGGTEKSKREPNARGDWCLPISAARP